MWTCACRSIHPTAAKMTSSEGLLPDWIIYHEFVETSKPFLRNVCAVEPDWVAPIIHKLQESDARALSKAGPSGTARSKTAAQPASELGAKGQGSANVSRADVSTLSEAKARAIARRAARPVAKGKKAA
jgi:ATP-dependent RNA helicase DHX8/PRP22